MVGVKVRWWQSRGLGGEEAGKAGIIIDRQVWPRHRLLEMDFRALLRWFWGLGLCAAMGECWASAGPQEGSVPR